MTDTDAGTHARAAAGSDSDSFDSAGHQARLAELYRDFEAAGMTPLWLTREGLMPFHPQPRPTGTSSALRAARGSRSAQRPRCGTARGWGW